MNTFKQNKYCVIKKAISSELASFCFNYFMMKRDVVAEMFKANYISPYEEIFGIWNDRQVPDTYSHYADLVMETLLKKVLPVMEKHTNLKLFPTYSYSRIYKKGDVLLKHKDRASCKISTTLNLGGDSWPIFLEPNPKKGRRSKDKYIPSKSKGIQINLEPGDMLVYSGCELEHWRNKFEGKDCAQVFLHYNEVTEKNAPNLFDSRPMLGLPSEFKNNNFDYLVK